MGKIAKIWSGTEWITLGDVTEASSGKTPYELAVENGYVGTEAQWLTSRKGPTGNAGPTGNKGIQGPVGLGLPSGGLYGYVLMKNSDDSYDTKWVEVYGTSALGEVSPTIGAISSEDAASGGTNTKVFINPVDGGIYKIHRFTYVDGADTLLKVTEGFIGKLLVVGGGGASGNGGSGLGGGGGGGGTLFYGDYAFGVGNHLVRIGTGGVNTGSRNGGSSQFDDIICYGGGGGGNANDIGSAGGSAGGNGEGVYQTLARTATGGFGYSFPTNFYYSANNGVNGGGASLQIDITGSNYTYGANGNGDQGASAAATTFGGGANGGPSTGANGFNGIVIVRYRIG